MRNRVHGKCEWHGEGCAQFRGRRSRWADSLLASLLRDPAGNLYGTTHGSGTVGYGTVFELSATGMETILHIFAGYPTDGQGPQAVLVRDAAGNLNGTSWKVALIPTERCLS